MADEIKAALRLVLYAGETEVAESRDEELWQMTLAKMRGHTTFSRGHDGRRSDEADRLSGKGEPPIGTGHDNALDRWASAMGVSPEQVEGACSPSREAPFLHLNAHNWEAIKKNTPSRGSNGVSPMKLAATLLALWHYYAKTEAPSVAIAQAVLKTINLYDTQAARGLDAAEWVRRSGETFTINPGKLSQALALATAYVSEQPIRNGK